MNKIRKYLLIILCLFSLLTITGCQERKKGPNEGRGTDYTYDFIDYVDIKVYGQNGLGYLEISPKEISVEDFNSERDYINAKSDLELYNFYFVQGMRNPSNFTISQTTQLTNGDVVTISPKNKDIKSNMNMEPYDYVVDGLGDSAIIDLFSNDLVIFYALTDGSYHVYLKDNPLYSEELRENLEYTIETKDKPVPGQAVLDVSVNLNKNFLAEQGCSSITIYLAKNNQRANTSMQKVLNELIEPLDMSSANSAGVESALYKELYKVEPDLAKICNVQQLERQRSTEPYTYSVVYYTSKDGIRTYRRRDAKIIAIDGTYEVIQLGNGSVTDEAYAKEPYDGAYILLDYMIDDAPTRTEEETLQNAEEVAKNSENAESEEVSN